MEPSNMPLDGAANNTPDQQPQPQPLPSVAQMAYDRYGVLDPVKLDLMIRGIFISREHAATLPSRITADGRPELNSLHASHHSRPPRSSSSSHRGVSRTAAAGVVNGPRAVVGARLRESSVAVSSGGRSGATDVSAVPSDREKWGEREIEMIIRMKAERVKFQYIAERLPGKNQKAVQEKFYKVTKDPRDLPWKRLYHQLRARHDRVMAFNSGTLEDPIEINSDEGTKRQPIDISSGTVSEATTVAEPEEDSIENFENGEAAMKDVKMAE